MVIGGNSCFSTWGWPTHKKVLATSSSRAGQKLSDEGQGGVGHQGTICAVNGVHASTSLWCTRALTTSVDGVQTDQDAAEGEGSCVAEGGTSCFSSLVSEGSGLGCQDGRVPRLEQEVHSKQDEVKKKTISTSCCGDGDDGKQMDSARPLSRMMSAILESKKVMEDLMWSEVEHFKECQMDGEKWNQYVRSKIVMLDFVFGKMTSTTPGLWELGDGKMANGKLKEHIFSTIVLMISQEVQIKFFMERLGSWSNLENHGQMDLAKEETDRQEGASGSMEDMSRDANLRDESKKNGRSFYREFAEKKNKKESAVTTTANEVKVFLDFEQKAMNCNLRGGMANMFEVLGQEEQDEEPLSGIDASYMESEEEEVSEITENENEESFHTTSSGGRSFYAEYFAKRTSVRGGAGGANTTKNKKLTEAIGALAEVVRSFEATPEEPESIDQVIVMIGDAVKAWQTKMPTRNEMKSQLRKFHQILEKDAHQLADARGSRDDTVGKGPQQSFYEGFARRFQQESEDGNDNSWQTKGREGKGRGKGGKDKGKGKNANGPALPRFDVMKILPTKALTTWQVLGKELESAREPTGKAVVMDSIEKMAEYQALSKAHGLTSSITMIAKYGDEDLTGLSNPVKMWLPYLSNLALVQAVVTTTTGEKTTLTGIEPVQKEGRDKEEEAKLVTLRMVVDLKLVKDKKVREHYKEQPHSSLHHALGQCSFKEVKTHGWTVGDELLTGYCTVKPENVDEILRLSGKAGLFSSRLRQDVAEQPPVCWIKKLDGETDMQYHDRAMEKADGCKVALTRRNGGGAYLGLLKEDDETRNRAWQISGVPHTWGPSSVRTWLESNDWYVETAPKPPNGKFKTWAVQGYVKSEPLKKNFAYQIKSGSKDCNITIYRWQKQRKPNAEEKEKDKHIKGARWWSSDMSDPIEQIADSNEVSPTLRYTPEVAETLMDVDDVENQGEGQAGKRLSAEAGKNGSPQKKRTRTTGKTASPEATLQGGSQGPLGSLLLNLGGGGDCGWRSLAWSFATANKTPSDKAIDNIETLATTLRIKVVNFLKTNCTRWKDSWCPDDKATVITEDGEPAADYQTFLTVLDRPRRWLCGLGLTAAALQMKCNIIIWQFDGKASETYDMSKWRRAAIIKGCRGSDNGRNPIVALVLHRGHYFALRYPTQRKAWPREWLITPEESEKSIPVTQEVEEAAGLSAICRGGGWEQDGFSTPMKSKVNKDIEEMLRSFSSKGTSTKKATSGIDNMLRTCSTICESARRSSSTVKKHILKPPKTWTCPVCQEVMDVESCRRPTDVITTHLSRRHTAIYKNAVEENKKINRWGSGMGMVGLVKHIAFVKMDRAKWEEEAEFVCPYCEMVLPFLGGKRNQKGGRGHLLRLSKKHHLRFACKHRHQKKDVTLRQYYFDYLAKYGQMLGSNTSWYMQSKYVEAAKKRGHDPVVFVFNKKAVDRRSKHQMICKTCRKGLSSGDQGNSQCKGVASRKAFNPGRIFWAQVTMNRKKKEAMQKLEMTAKEVDQAYAAVSAFRAIVPSKRRIRAEQLRAERAARKEQL